MKFPQNRKYNAITAGRANVDFYPPIGVDLDQARAYDVYVGGSPANISAGIAKRGLKAAIITRVADDLHGRFVYNYLQNLGIDVSQVQFDKSGAKTSLAFAERKTDSRLCMYRHNVADLHLNANEVQSDFIAQAQALVITGFALTQEPSRQSNFKLLSQAKASGTIAVMDIDYRPYNWVSAQEAAQVTSMAARLCDILIGTRAEFEVAGAKKTDSDYECAQRFIDNGSQLVILKRDKEGSTAFTADGDIIENGIYPVDMLKPFGAGDAFAANLLASLLTEVDLKNALKDAAAAASINISGISCTEAMPTTGELKKFQQKYNQ